MDQLTPEQEFARAMAVEDVNHAQQSLDHSLKWRRRNGYWLWWYSCFGVGEIVLGTIDVFTHASLFSTLLCYGVGIGQIPLIWLNRRSNRTYDMSIATWIGKLNLARENLRQLDPNNALFPLVIEEEP